MIGMERRNGPPRSMAIFSCHDTPILDSEMSDDCMELHKQHFGNGAR